MVELEGGKVLAYQEMKGTYHKGEEVLVIELEDGSVSAKIYNHLTATDRYKVGDVCEGIVYEKKTEMGAFVAVDDMFHGLIPLNELYSEAKVGNRIRARVTKIIDGKLRLSTREKGDAQRNKDVEALREALSKGGGILYINDDSDPELIKRKLDMSKKAFKRAAGHLLKLGEIQMLEDAIELVKK